MKRSMALVLLLTAQASLANQHDDTPINSGSDLRDWCKEESEAALIGKGLTPFNWTASYWDQGTMFMVKGQWRIEGSNMSVQCSVARGAKARFASMSIQESQ